MRHPERALAPALAAVLSAACGPSVQVDHWHPASIDVDGARHAIVTDAFGRSDSVPVIASLAADALRQEAWFNEVTDLSGRDRLETDGPDAWLRHGSMVPGAVYLRFDVYEDFAVATGSETPVQQPDGSVAIVVEEQVVATTLLALTVADADGVIVDALELEGRHEATGPVDDTVIADAMARAAGVAVAAAIAEVTPRRDRVSVPIDERDDEVMRIVAPAVDGPTVARLDAIAALAALERTPAVYNRAALLESIGDLDGALPLYRAAARAEDAADFAATTLAGAEARSAAAAAVGL